MPTRQHLPIRLIQTITVLDLLTTLIRHVTLYCTTDPKLAFGLLSHRRLVTEDPETSVPTARFKRAVPAASLDTRYAHLRSSQGRSRNLAMAWRKLRGRRAATADTSNQQAITEWTPRGYVGTTCTALRRRQADAYWASSPRRSTRPPPQYAGRPLLGGRIGFMARWSNARSLGNQHGCQVTCRSPW